MLGAYKGTKDHHGDTKIMLNPLNLLDALSFETIWHLINSVEIMRMRNENEATHLP